jgi:hypothetical protein
MTYSLVQLAAGSYDVVLDGEIVASIMRVKTQQGAIWYAELLEDLPGEKRPQPFQEIEHQFGSLEDICIWLGHPTVTQIRRDPWMS